MKVDPKLLPAFQAVADRLSFSVAAISLGVTQPRVSLLIRRLEEQMGFKLFDRTSRTVRLSKSGEAVLRANEALHRAMTAFDVTIEEERKRAQNRRIVRLGTPHYTRAAPARNALLDAYATQMSDVEIEIVNDTTVPLLASLRSGELDFVMATVPFDSSGLETQRFAKSMPMIGVPREHRLAKEQLITPAMLCGERLIVLPDRIGGGYFNHWYGEFSDAGVILVRSPEAVASAAFRLAEVQRSFAILQVWDPTKPSETRTSMVAVNLASRTDVATECHMVRRSGYAPDHLQAFWELAREIAIRHNPFNFEQLELQPH